jgi:hypothetical protein
VKLRQNLLCQAGKFASFFLNFIQLNDEEFVPTVCLYWKIRRIIFYYSCETPRGYDKVPALLMSNGKIRAKRLRSGSKIVSS